MVGPIGRIVKLVGSGVGLAREHHYNKKLAKAESSRQGAAGNSTGAESSTQAQSWGDDSKQYPPEKGELSREIPPVDPDDTPPQYVEVSEEHAEKLIAAGKAEPVDLEESSDDDDDEDDWRLDEAADEIDPPTYDESEAGQAVSAHGDARGAPLEETQSESVQKTTKLVNAVLDVAPPASSRRGPLSLPVVLPQRRPRAKGRGFVRAYAPMLNECAVDQKTFLTFLKSYHEASKVSGHQFSP
jgi:hypothetical protein